MLAPDSQVAHGVCGEDLHSRADGVGAIYSTGMSCKRCLTWNKIVTPLAIFLFFVGVAVKYAALYRSTACMLSLGRLECSGPWVHDTGCICFVCVLLWLAPREVLFISVCRTLGCSCAPRHWRSWSSIVNAFNKRSEEASLRDDGEFRTVFTHPALSSTLSIVVNYLVTCPHVLDMSYAIIEMRCTLRSRLHFSVSLSTLLAMLSKRVHCMALMLVQVLVDAFFSSGRWVTFWGSSVSAGATSTTTLFRCDLTHRNSAVCVRFAQTFLLMGCSTLSVMYCAVFPFKRCSVPSQRQCGASSWHPLYVLLWYLSRLLLPFKE